MGEAALWQPLVMVGGCSGWHGGRVVVGPGLSVSVPVAAVSALRVSGVCVSALRVLRAAPPPSLPKHMVYITQAVRACAQRAAPRKQGDAVTHRQSTHRHGL